MQTDRCKRRVRSDTMGWHDHQCKRKAWKDGFCKQHHPTGVAKREEEKEKRYQEKAARDPWRQLQTALGRIQELEAEVARLKGKEPK